MRRDDPKVLEAVERLFGEGNSQNQTARLVDAELSVEPPFINRDNLRSWLRNKKHLKRKGPATATVTLDQRIEREKADIVKRAEQRDYAQQLRERAKQDIFTDKLQAAILQLPPIEPVPPVVMPQGRYGEEHAVLMLSDAHVGYWLTQEASGGLWAYDYQTFRSYVRLIVDKVRQIIPRHNYRVPVLHVHFLGDLIENQIMRPGQGYEIEFGLVKQVMAAAQDFAWMLRALLPLFERIEVTVIPGNHGRMSEKFGDLPVGESFDLIVGEFLRAYLANEPRIKVCVVDAKRTVVEVLGWRIMLTHGDGIRGGFAGVPHYGRDRHNANVSALYDDLSEGIDIIEMGHFHDPHEGTFRTWGRYFVNGCFTGASAYSLERMNRATQPAQWFFGVSRERSVTWQYLLCLAEPRRRQPG